MQREATKIYFDLIGRGSLQLFTKLSCTNTKKDIDQRTEEYILGISPTTYIDFLVQEYTVDTPTVDFTTEKTILEKGQQSSPSRDLSAEPVLTFTYHLPFRGNYHFLAYLFDIVRMQQQQQNTFFQYYIKEPKYEKIGLMSEKTCVSLFINTYQYFGHSNYSQHLMTTEEIKADLEDVEALHSIIYGLESTEVRKSIADELKRALEDSDTLCEPYIYLEVITTKKKGSDITSDLRVILREFKRLMQDFSAEIEKHNKEVKKTAERLFHARKRMHEKQNAILQSLKFPVKKRTDIPLTFTVPAEQIRKRLKIQQPVVLEQGYYPEPTLDENIYLDILRTIYEVGKAMSRLSSVSKNRYEEDLRDLFLIYLAPRYDAAVTGETFNGDGRTDILIRWKNSNVFVAECKVWHGPQKYTNGLDQLLGNVTYRDTKAAYIIFVKKSASSTEEEALSQILPKVRTATEAHTNCLRFLRAETDAWLTYRFRVKDDPNKEVHLAVILIWIPWE